MTWTRHENGAGAKPPFGRRRRRRTGLLCSGFSGNCYRLTLLPVIIICPYRSFTAHAQQLTCRISSRINTIVPLFTLIWWKEFLIRIGF